MKILYIAAQNVVGQLEFWRQVHEARGNRCRYVTFFPSPSGFPDDICLQLPLLPHTPLGLRLRAGLYHLTRGPGAGRSPLPGNPPVWRPRGKVERAFFAWRDQLWRFWVEPAIERYGLLDYDVYHLDGGLGFYRHGQFVSRLARLGKPILVTYNGMDFRQRGVLPPVDRQAWLNLTSEYDLISRHPNMRYLFLPFDADGYPTRLRSYDRITICHAPRNRRVKGSDVIISACRSLEKSHNVRFSLIENRPHDECMALKAQADIYVDQVTDAAPGYGMNSVEAMALGLACCTRMNAAYQALMPQHPFVNVTPENLLDKLTELVESPPHIAHCAQAGRRWLETHHSLAAAGDQLYGYYRSLGIVA